MNRTILASKILKVAKDMLAMEFDTEEALKKYKQDHDVRPGTKMTVAPQSDQGNSSVDRGHAKVQTHIGNLESAISRNPNAKRALSEVKNYLGMAEKNKDNKFQSASHLDAAKKALSKLNSSLSEREFNQHQSKIADLDDAIGNLRSDLNAD